MIKYDACELSDLIERVYGVEFNVPYLIMMEQKLIERTVHRELYEGQEDLVKEFKQGLEPDSWEQTFEALLNDLCIKKKLKKGNYLIEFDD